MNSINYFSQFPIFLYYGQNRSQVLGGFSRKKMLCTGQVGSLDLFLYFFKTVQEM